MPIFLSYEDIESKMRQCQKSIYYSAPGITIECARALVDFYRKHANSGIDVFLDSRKEVYEICLSDINAVKYLLQNGIKIKSIKNLRVGMIRFDDQVYIFSPIPLFDKSSYFNAYQTEFTDIYFSEPLSEAIITPETAYNSNSSGEPADEVKELKLEDVEKISNGMPDNYLELASILNQLEPLLLFCELKFYGAKLEQKNYELPQDLIELLFNDKNVSARMKTIYKAIEENLAKNIKDLLEPFSNEIDEIRDENIFHVNGDCVMFTADLMTVNEKIQKLQLDLKNQHENIKKVYGENLKSGFDNLVNSLPESSLKERSKLYNFDIEKAKDEIKKMLIDDFQNNGDKKVIDKIKIHFKADKKPTLEWLKTPEFINTLINEVRKNLRKEKKYKIELEILMKFQRLLRKK